MADLAALKQAMDDAYYASDDANLGVCAAKAVADDANAVYVTAYRAYRRALWEADDG